jgi:hypothetical protein
MTKRASVALGFASLRAHDIVQTVKFTGLLINGYLTHEYLDSDIVSVLEQLISTASLIRGKSGENLFVIYSTHYIDKEICQRNNNADRYQ